MVTSTRRVQGWRWPTPLAVAFALALTGCDFGGESKKGGDEAPDNRPPLVRTAPLELREVCPERADRPPSLPDGLKPRCRLVVRCRSRSPGPAYPDAMNRPPCPCGVVSDIE